MTRVMYSREGGDVTLTIKGHTRTDICAAVSAIVETAALGLKAIAQTHPESVAFDDESPAQPKRAPP